jgi:hypothetical protein
MWAPHAGTRLPFPIQALAHACRMVGPTCRLHPTFSLPTFSLSCVLLMLQVDEYFSPPKVNTFLLLWLTFALSLLDVLWWAGEASLFPMQGGVLLRQELPEVGLEDSSQCLRAGSADLQRTCDPKLLQSYQPNQRILKKLPNCHLHQLDASPRQLIQCNERLAPSHTSNDVDSNGLVRGRDGNVLPSREECDVLRGGR